MKLIFKITFLSFCYLLASCSLIDFSEDCTYYGNVEVNPDWSGLLQGEVKPPLTEVYFLSPQAKERMLRIVTDTLLENIPAFSYNVLAFNSQGLADVHFTGMDHPQTAQAVLRTSEQNGKLYTVQAPALYASNTDLTVIPYETVVCTPVLQSAVRQINIDFVIVDNTRIGVKSIDGELSGIAYRYAFSSLEQVESSAWLAFGSERNNEKSNVFSSRLKVFGANPDKQRVNKIDNRLEIALQTMDGKRHTQSIDLTTVFSGFTTRMINITLEVRLSDIGIEVAITGWNVSDGGTIEL